MRCSPLEVINQATTSFSRVHEIQNVRHSKQSRSVLSTRWQQAGEDESVHAAGYQDRLQAAFYFVGRPRCVACRLWGHQKTDQAQSRMRAEATAGASSCKYTLLDPKPKCNLASPPVLYSSSNSGRRTYNDVHDAFGIGTFR